MTRWRIRVLARIRFGRIRAFRRRSNLRSVKSIFFLQGINYHIFVQIFSKCLEQVLRCIMISDIESFFNNKNLRFFFRKNARTPNGPEYAVRPNSGEFGLFRNATYPNTPRRFQVIILARNVTTFENHSSIKAYEFVRF